MMLEFEDRAPVAPLSLLERASLGATALLSIYGFAASFLALYRMFRWMAAALI